MRFFQALSTKVCQHGCCCCQPEKTSSYCNLMISLGSKGSGYMWLYGFRYDLCKTYSKLHCICKHTINTVSLCCTLFKVWLLSLGAEYISLLQKMHTLNFQNQFLKLASQKVTTESCSLLRIFMAVFKKIKNRAETIGAYSKVSL